MRLALVHYAAPPVVGGVERIIEQQTQLLLQHGHEVVIVCANQDAALSGAEIRIISSSWQEHELREALQGCDAVIVHNMFTMPFHNDAAVVLARLSHEWRTVNWVHDVDVPREWFESLHLKAQNVAVSDSRNTVLKEKLGVGDAKVIPNGINPAKTLGWSARVETLVHEHRLMERELVLFHPSRVLQRKNMEMGLAVTSELRRQGADAMYLVSGAPDPHRPSSAAYAQFLQEQMKSLELTDAAIFVGSDGVASESEMRSLYALADLVFFPSRSEGFGLPLLEAALHRLPVLCSDIAPHREVALGNAHFFDLGSSPAQVAALVRKIVPKGTMKQARQQVMQRYSWTRIYEDYLEPLLNEG